MSTKEFHHCSHRVVVGPAEDILAASIYSNEPGLSQLLYVVRDRGRRNIELFSQFTDIPASLIGGNGSFGLGTACHEAEKNAQTMWI